MDQETREALRFQFSNSADHFVLRPIHQCLQSLLQLPFFAFVDLRPMRPQYARNSSMIYRVVGG